MIKGFCTKWNVWKVIVKYFETLVNYNAIIRKGFCIKLGMFGK